MNKVLNSSLVALGFNPSLLEQKYKSSRDKASKKLSADVGNQILYFLFKTIDPAHASKVFRDCWPIFDKKKEAAFRTVCFEWFKQLNQNGDFNLKPELVVSKAAVDPSSYKFVKTLQTLTRMAMRIAILRTDPSCPILHLPTLASTSHHRVTAMMMIQSLKLSHSRNYISSSRLKLQNFKILEEKSRELVVKYRSLVAEREKTRETILNEIQNSEFLSHKMKEKYKTVQCISDHNFHDEIETAVVAKNKEIKQLWSGVERQHNTDTEIWPVISAVISGDKGLTRIDGNKYIMKLKQMTDTGAAKSKDGNDLLTRDGKLDLLAVLNHSRNILQLLLSKAENSQKDFRPEDKDEIIQQENRAKSLIKSLQEIRAETSSMHPGLMRSIDNMREKLDQCPQIFERKCKDEFDLCPPTPPFKLHSDSVDQTVIETPFKLFSLNPDLCKPEHRKVKQYGTVPEIIFTPSNLGKEWDAVQGKSNSLSCIVKDDTFIHKKFHLGSAWKDEFEANQGRGESLQQLHNKMLDDVDMSARRLKRPVGSLTKNLSSSSQSLYGVPLDADKKTLLKTFLTKTFEVPSDVATNTFPPSLNSSFASDCNKSAAQTNLTMCIASIESLLNTEPNANSNYRDAGYDFKSTVSLSRDYPTVNPETPDKKCETFFDAAQFEDLYSLDLEKQKSNSRLNDSVFETVTESLVAGELDSCHTLDDDVMEEIRRESLLSRRESVLCQGQRTNALSRRLSEVFQLKLNTHDIQNISAEDDSCLLSASMEEF